MQKRHKMSNKRLKTDIDRKRRKHKHLNAQEDIRDGSYII